MNDPDDDIVRDYWVNAKRVTQAQLNEFCRLHSPWIEVRKTMWRCTNAILQLEVIPGVKPSVLFWAIEINREFP